jgi:hypothetical protein
MMKLTELPPLPQPKHLKIPLAGETVKDGVFSLWNGQRPSRLTPLRFSETNSETTSVICAASKIRSMVEWSIMEVKVSKKAVGRRQ